MSLKRDAIVNRFPGRGAVAATSPAAGRVPALDPPSAPARSWHGSYCVSQAVYPYLGPYIGQMLDTLERETVNILIRLASPRGFEPLLPP